MKLLSLIAYTICLSISVFSLIQDKKDFAILFLGYAILFRTFTMEANKN